jgi:hypothetical protein
MYGGWNVTEIGGDRGRGMMDAITFDHFNEFKLRVPVWNLWYDQLLKYICGNYISGSWYVENNYIYIKITNLPSSSAHLKPVISIMMKMVALIQWTSGPQPFRVQVVSESELILSTEESSFRLEKV